MREPIIARHVAVTIALPSLILAITSTTLHAQSIPSPDASLREYLTDMGATPVSAGGLVGLQKSAITNVQSSRDVLVAITPAVTGGGKSGFGFSLNPARSSIDAINMSGRTYNSSAIYRLLGSTSISYAENSATISGLSYQQYGVSLDTTYYFEKKDDPVIAAYGHFLNCPTRKQFEEESDRLAVEINKSKDESRKRELEEQKKDANEKAATAHQDCLAAGKKKLRWNASKLSASWGTGRIKPENPGLETHSLGRAITVSAIKRIGEDGALFLTYKRTSGEIDTTTLRGTASYKSSSLAGLRYTYGSNRDTDTRWLVEVSNARNATPLVSNAVYKHAIGLDRRISDGLWLELRVGKSQHLDGPSSKTLALLTLNWTPSSSLFAK